MTAPKETDDWSGALNCLFHSEDLKNYHELVNEYYGLTRIPCSVIEMECLSEYDFILETYDSAIGLALDIINHKFPVATTEEDFENLLAQMKKAVDRLNAVERVLRISFINNFIQFD